MQLAKHNRVQLIWVEIEGNEMADELAKLGSERLFTGPEPPCGISMAVTKKVIMDWTIRDHRQQDSNRQRCSYRGPLPRIQENW
jgi:hypothetical protein